MRLDQAAAQTWNQERGIEERSAAIHDGARINDELRLRARRFVSEVLFGNFPHSVPRPGARILEIGSGLGWIMQAMDEYLTGLDCPPQSIVGLDIAPSMIETARRRIASAPRLEFLEYDGISIPMDDSSLDLIYSVTALQHVPRPFVFNLFFEMRRLLKSRGFAVFSLLSTDSLPRQEASYPWRTEIHNQIFATNAHWHHFYTAKELRDVLAITGFPYIDVADSGSGSLVCCVSDTQPQSQSVAQPPDRVTGSRRSLFRILAKKLAMRIPPIANLVQGRADLIRERDDLRREVAKLRGLPASCEDERSVRDASRK